MSIMIFVYALFKPDFAGYTGYVDFWSSLADHYKSISWYLRLIYYLRAIGTLNLQVRLNQLLGIILNIAP
jgi:hypothetical protein